MTKILIRFVSIYFFSMFAIKLMGKRQIGEMQTTELVTTIFLSELATYTATARDLPIYYGLVPICVMITIGVLISYLVIKVPIMKRIFDFSPSVLIKEGKVSERELKRNRMTLDELFSLMRLAGFYDVNQVRFAILEPNGQLSVIPYERCDKPSCEDLGMTAEETGYSVALIDDGVINKKALCTIGKDEKWLNKVMKKEHICSHKDVFLLSSDFLGNVKLIEKEKKSAQ